MKTAGASVTYFKQCLLRRGTVRQILWVEEKFAEPGKYVRIKDEDGWLVVCAWQRGTAADIMPDGRDRRNEFASLQ